MTSTVVNLEVLQKALGFRFGDHNLVRTALGSRGDDTEREWLAEVGRAAVVSVLCEQGPLGVRTCLTDESLTRVGVKLGVGASAVCCVLGAIRFDISYKKQIGVLQGVFANLFDLPAKDGNRQFVQFHNALNGDSFTEMERLLTINNNLVHDRTKDNGDTALMLVLKRRKGRGVAGIYRSMRPSD
jgi:hypothetical protein